MIVGKTNLPELAIWPFTESADAGARPATRGTRTFARRLQRRRGGGGRVRAWSASRTPATAAGSIRDPGRLLRALRPEAAARTRVSLMPDAEHWYGLSVFGCVSPHGARLGALPRRRARPRGRATRTPRAEPPMLVRRGGRDAARQAADRLHDQADRSRGRSPTWSSRPSTTPPSSCARSATTCASSTRAGASSCPASCPRYLRRDPRRRDRMAAPGAARAAHAAARGFGERLRKRPLRRALTAEAEARAPPRRAVRRIRRADDADDGAACRSRPTAGRARARPRPSTASPATCRSRRPGTSPASPPRRFPPASPPEGLPLSVQLIGRPADETTLMSLSAQLEAERPWTDRRPPVS